MQASLDITGLAIIGLAIINFAVMGLAIIDFAVKFRQNTDFSTKIILTIDGDGFADLRVCRFVNA